MGQTILGELDLRTVKGLETIMHVGPSHLTINTVYRSQGNIPDVFVRHTGGNEMFIAYMRSLAGRAIEYYTCFISVRLVSPKPAQVGGRAGKECSFHN